MNWNVLEYRQSRLTMVIHGCCFFYLMMVEKWYTFGVNHTLNFEFDLFLSQ